MKAEERMDWIERYVEGRLSAAEKEQFEEMLAADAELLKSVEDYTQLRKEMERFYRLRHFRKRLQSAAQAYFSHQQAASLPPLPPQIVPDRRRVLWKYHLSSILVAASVAAVVTIFAVNYYKVNSLEVRQKNYYQALKRDIDAIREQSLYLMQQNQPKEEEPMPALSGSATAFLINPKGYLLTTYHAVADARKIELVQYNAVDTLKLNAELVHFNKLLDLALIRISDSLYTYAASYFPLRLYQGVADLGEEVFTLAYPREDLVYGVGAVSAHSGYEGDSLSYEISIPVNPGNSGSPLLDSQARLVGVITGKHTQAESAAFAVKSRYIDSFLQECQQITGQELLAKSLYESYAPLRFLQRTRQIKQLRTIVFELKTYQKPRVR